MTVAEVGRLTLENWPLEIMGTFLERKAALISLMTEGLVSAVVPKSLAVSFSRTFF